MGEEVFILPRLLWSFNVPTLVVAIAKTTTANQK